MIKRLGQIALGVLTLLALGAAGLFAWGASDPPGCEANDPAVALANARARAGEPYRDWCHAHDGNQLHVVEAGEGETVLFIHGFPTIWYSMIRPMEALREDYRVVAIDGLGAGRSDAPQAVEEYKLARMSEHLDALIDDLGGGPVHLVGHDWGAAFAGAYAQSRPEKLKTVTIMSAPPQNIAVRLLETSERQRQISQYVERLKSSSPALGLLVGAKGRIASGPANHLKAGRMSPDEASILQDGTSDLRRINRHINWYRANLPAPDAISDGDFWPSREATFTLPTLVIWGEEDTVFDPAFIDLMDASDTEGSLSIVRIKGVGHAPQFEAPQRVIEAIKDHLSAAHVP